MWILGLGWILALGMVQQSQAQNDDLIFVDHRKAEVSLAKAVEPAALGEYAKATGRVVAVCQQYPDYAPAWLTLGELHLKLQEWGPAVKAFENSIRLHQRLSIKAYHGLAQAAMQVGDYESVLKYCVEVPTFRLASEDQLRDLALWRKQAQWALEAMKRPEPFDLQVAPSALLGDGASYLPCLCRNGTQMVFTRRGTEGEDFFESQLIDSNWQQAHALESPLNSDLDEGGCWLSPDGQMIWFTGCYRDGGLGSCDLYYSIRKDGRWQNAVWAGSVINSTGWDAQPTLSSDGLTLYFASTRQGGLGGSDLWVSYGKVDSTDWPLDTLGNPEPMPWWQWKAMEPDKLLWTEPIPLGQSLNTAYNENSPYLHPNGRDLYYASAGREGMGNMDLYRARKKPGPVTSDASGWTADFQRLKNMGVPVVLWHEPVNLGYPLNTFADEMGFVLEANGNSAWMSRPYQGRIALHRLGLAKSALPLMDPENSVLAQIPDSLSGSKAEQEWILRDIYFEVNAYTPLPASRASLLELASWIKKNPELRIEIQGHTDNTGNLEKNRMLSQQRADAVLRSLLGQGCAAGQLSAVGYGSSQPIASNNSAEGRALNRRTQIKILP
jgi:outer membrane protein OmpA-like peptidoglycan-associated protein